MGCSFVFVLSVALCLGVRMVTPVATSSYQTLVTLLLSPTCGHGRRHQLPRRFISRFTRRKDSAMHFKGDEQKSSPRVSVPTPQVLRLRDATTQQEISIVGTLHHNPVSIARAKEEIIASIARNDQNIGAVVLEMCETRLNRSFESASSSSRESDLLPSEFREAASIAQQNGVPVLLGDPEVSIFLHRAKDLYNRSLIDLLNPLQGGWQAIFQDISRNMVRAFDTSDIARSDLLLPEEMPFSLTSFVSLEMLRGILSTFWRYPLVLAASAPSAIGRLLSFWLTYFLGCFYIQALAVAGDPAQMIPPVDGIESYSLQLESGPLVDLGILELSLVGFFLVSIAVIIILVRVFAVVIYEERDRELARSIRRAAAATNGPVVAILGGLHANGVARFLLSTEDIDSYGLEAKSGVWWKDSRDTILE